MDAKNRAKNEGPELLPVFLSLRANTAKKRQNKKFINFVVIVWQTVGRYSKMSYITKNQRFGLWFAGDKTAGWQDFVVGVYIAIVYII